MSLFEWHFLAQWHKIWLLVEKCIFCGVQCTFYSGCFWCVSNQNV